MHKENFFIRIELLSALNSKRKNQGYVLNFQIYSHYQVHKMCINLQNCKFVGMLHEEILELFDTPKSMTIFVRHILISNKKEVIFIYFNFYVFFYVFHSPSFPQGMNFFFGKFNYG